MHWLPRLFICLMEQITVEVWSTKLAPCVIDLDEPTNVDEFIRREKSWGLLLKQFSGMLNFYRSFSCLISFREYFVFSINDK